MKSLDAKLHDAERPPAFMGLPRRNAEGAEAGASRVNGQFARLRHRRDE